MIGRSAEQPVILLFVLLALLGGAVKVSAAESGWAKYRGMIQQADQRYTVDPALIRAVIKVESNFNPDAVSHADAVGLMQIFPRTATDYGVDERQLLFDPATNIDVGTRHLKRLLVRYKNISRALNAYHAGEGNAQQFRRVGVFVETRRYTVRVIKYFQQYQ